MPLEDAVVVDVEKTENNEGMEHNNHQQQVSDNPGLMGKKLSLQKLKRYDSLEMESRRFRSSHTHASKVSATLYICPLSFICTLIISSCTYGQHGAFQTSMEKPI